MQLEQFVYYENISLGHFSHLNSECLAYLIVKIVQSNLVFNKCDKTV